MPIQSIGSSLPVTNILSNENSLKPTSLEAQQKFGTFLIEAINDVNKSQIKSDILTEKLALGKDVELHEVMIAAQKASITLNATMEVRNKVIEAYQEIIRMPI